MLKKQIVKSKCNVQMTALAVFCLAMFLLFCGMANARTRSMKAPPPEKVEAIIIGDRVLDIAYNLDVLPVAMSVRGSLWLLSSEINVGSQILGCPNNTTVYNLPFYIDSSVMEYPDMLRQWIAALSD